MIANPSAPKRGEIWQGEVGGKKHTYVIISVDERNLSQRVTSVLGIPFGSYGAAGPTTLRMEPGETGLPESSFLKAHFIQVLEKRILTRKLPRMFSNRQMKNLVAMVRRAIDPDAPYEE